MLSLNLMMSQKVQQLGLSEECVAKTGENSIQILPLHLGGSYFNNWLIGVVVKDIAINAGGLGFDSRGDLFRTLLARYRCVANGSPPLRRFFGAALPRS